MANGNGTTWRAQPFTRLRATVKDNIDEEIGPLTLWVGPNQSGKSGRIIGVDYALVGISGYSAGPHGSDVAKLAPEGTDEFFTELSGPSGTASFRVRQEKGKWKDPDSKTSVFSGELLEHMTLADRERILPLATMSDLLGLGPDLGRRRLIQRFGDLEKVPRPLGLDEARTKLWDEVEAEVTKSLTKKDEKPDPSAVLAGMTATFNSRKLAAGKRLKETEAEIEGRRQALLQQAAGAEQLPKLREQRKEAAEWEAAAHLRARLAEIEQSKVAYREAKKPFDVADAARPERQAAEDAQHTKLVEAIEGAQAELARLVKDAEDQRRRLANGDGWMQSIAFAKANPTPGGECLCPLCKNPFDADGAMAFIKEAVADRQASIAMAEAKIAPARVAVQKALAALQQWETGLQQAAQADKAARDRLVQEHARITTAEQEVQRALRESHAPANYDGPPTAVLDATIAALETAQQARKKLEEDTITFRARKALRDAAKELEGEAKKLGDDLVASVKATAEAAVNEYMKPTGLRAVLDLVTNAWQVTDPSGAPRGRHFMCGFEENVLVPALAAAYTDGGALRVLTLDDRDLAGIGLENAVRFFGALAQAQREGWLTQIFCAGNRFEPVLEEIAAMGWTVIRTDRKTTPGAQFETPAQPYEPEFETPPVHEALPAQLELPRGLPPLFDDNGFPCL